MKPLRKLMQKADGKKTYGQLILLFLTYAYFTYQEAPAGLTEEKAVELFMVALATGVFAALRHAIQKTIDGYKLLRRGPRSPVGEE